MNYPSQQPEFMSYDAALTDSYNNGNGFTPLATTTRGNVLFQNKNSPNPNDASRSSPYPANGGANAGRSCLVVPSFGSGKKKKKKEKITKNNSPNRTPKKRGGGLFGRNSSSTDSVSTSAESSMPDPYQTHNNHNDKKSLLKSFSKKKSGGDADPREWYLETMVEEDEDGDQEISQNNSNSYKFPAQFGVHTPQQTPSPQTAEPQRENMGTAFTPNLLQLPKAEDRSHQARSRQKKMHAYQGELEPEGVRGQEARVVTSSHSPSRFERQSPATHLSNDQQQPVMRDFASSNTSESSSKSIPMHQVVSRRQQQIQNSLYLSPAGQNNEVEQKESTNNRMKTSPSIQARYSPGYEERMKVASSVLGASNTPRKRVDYSGYDEDVEHEEMISHNRAEFEREYKQQHKSQQLGPRGNKASPYSRIESVGSEDMRSSGTPTPSRSSRKSAPVSIDNASFENPLEHIRGIHSMAMEHVDKGEYDMALQAFTQVLDVYRKEHGENHPLTASAHHNIGTVHTKRAGLLPEHTLHQRHCREQALSCFQAAARSARDCPTLGPNHPNVAVSLVRIGFLLLQSRQYQNAVITFEEALRIRTVSYGLNHGLVANLFNNLGVCHMHLQQFPEGQKHLQKALDIQKKLLIQDGDDSSTALLELADTLCNIGGLNLEWIRRQGPDARHAADANSAFVGALKLRSKVLGEDHALTNQVRSLHDMVRSLPMPKSVEKTSEIGKGVNHTPSLSSSRHSSSTGKPSTFGGEYSPAAVSDLTGYDSTKQSNIGSPERSALSIPALKVRAGESSSAQKRSTPVSVRDNHNVASQRFMDDYDATEEIGLLRKPVADEESSSQVGGFVTYARSTVSNGSESNHNESDRMAMIRQAKDMLDSHQHFLDPANQKNKDTSADTERTIDERDGNAYEDGLVPLMGDWPGPKNMSRLSPHSLQNPSENLHTVHNCATSYLAKGRHTEAIALLEMVVECQKEKNGPTHANVGAAVHNVGIAYLRSEVYYKAFQSFEEAVRIRKAALGENHPAVSISLVKFGISLMLLQRHEESLWIFRDALAIRKQSLGDFHPSNARIYNNIGCVHVELGELDSARKNFESALDIQRRTLVQNSDNGPMIFGASTTLQNLGYLYGKNEMYEKAAMVLRESLSVSQNECK